MKISIADLAPDYASFPFEAIDDILHEAIQKEQNRYEWQQRPSQLALYNELIALLNGWRQGYDVLPDIGFRIVQLIWLRRFRPWTDDRNYLTRRDGWDELLTQLPRTAANTALRTRALEQWGFAVNGLRQQEAALGN